MSLQRECLTKRFRCLGSVWCVKTLSYSKSFFPSGFAYTYELCCINYIYFHRYRQTYPRVVAPVNRPSKPVQLCFDQWKGFLASEN